ncbi:DUF4397 domain-containing protein [Adhaeribacter radiodurans]|uniref:DUF4397 domain-containing protein n=1 Tax=Adhaeribacter radiodurans TaxID=2745197 RepID=A0A7L7LCP5_9BACT|nr:DUF4397 domain-containing protein [Adhaeribacter radiodurans]QMU30315.1 DUF4397 domain-containing protein [Adhaeribacter radiodurans]
MKKWLKLMMLVLLPALFLTACNDDDEDTDTMAKARVMVVHASPNAPAVDILVDNVKVNSSGLAFPNNSGYLDVMAGQRNVKVNAAGSATSVIDANLDLVAGQNYSVFAINNLANIEPLVLPDNLATPASGKAHVRFIHLSPDAPAVDIAVKDGPVLFSNRSFKSATDFTPVDATSYNLEVRLAGTNTVVLDLPGVALQNGKIYTVFARGYAAPPTGNTNTIGAQVIVNN